MVAFFVNSQYLLIWMARALSVTCCMRGLAFCRGAHSSTSARGLQSVGIEWRPSELDSRRVSPGHVLEMGHARAMSGSPSLDSTRAISAARSSSAVSLWKAEK